MSPSAYNIADLRVIARHRLPRAVFEFVDRGTEDDVSLCNNRAALDRIKLKPRVLVDVSRRTHTVSLFGQTWPIPIIVAPTGFADLVCFKGELALARAASRAGIPFTVATSSTTPFEQVARARAGPLWFQMYLWDDRELSYQVMRNAQAAGADTLLLTADTAVMANREYNRRNGFSNPLRFSRRLGLDMARHPRWTLGVMARYLVNGGLPRFVNYPGGLDTRVTRAPRYASSASVDWQDVGRLRDKWRGTFIVKGILSPEDAILAAEHGADGIVVSNHGGRNLDAAIAPIDVLASIVSAVGGRITVLYDSGIRRGADIAKAIALGAKAVLVGRATLYGLAADGEAGASHALSILSDEFDRVLALVGAREIKDLTPALIHAEPANIA